MSNFDYNIDNIYQKDEGNLDDRRRDGRTNFILRIKEQKTRLTLHEHDDDDDDDDDNNDDDSDDDNRLKFSVSKL